VANSSATLALRESRGISEVVAACRPYTHINTGANTAHGNPHHIHTT